MNFVCMCVYIYIYVCIESLERQKRTRNRRSTHAALSNGLHSKSKKDALVCFRPGIRATPRARDSLESRELEEGTQRLSSARRAEKRCSEIERDGERERARESERERERARESEIEVEKGMRELGIGGEGPDRR